MKDLSKKGAPVNFEEAFKTKRILYGTGRIAQRGEIEDEEDSILIECEDVLVTIPESETILQTPRLSLVSLIGVQVPFIITEYIPPTKEDGKPVVMGSQKRAVEAIKKPLIEQFRQGKTLTAVVSNIQLYGAYVTVGRGYVSMLLKNSDFSDDTTRCCDILEVGDKIKVNYLKETSTGTIICKAATPFHGSSDATTIDSFAVGQVCFGVVSAVKPYGGYVSISKNLDMLVSLPPNAELVEGMQVSCKIKKIIPEEGKIRGKIISILS